MFWLAVPETYTLELAHPARPAGTDARSTPSAARSAGVVRGRLGGVAQRDVDELDVRHLRRMRRAGPGAARCRSPRTRSAPSSCSGRCSGSSFRRRPSSSAIRTKGASCFRRRAAVPDRCSRALLFHTMVMPHIDLILEPKWGAVMSVQHSPIGSSGTLGRGRDDALGRAAAGRDPARTASRRDGDLRLRIVLGATLAGQVLLHLIYGEETFSVHAAPGAAADSVGGACRGASTTWRRVILALAVALGDRRCASTTRRSSRTALRIFLEPRNASTADGPASLSARTAVRPPTSCRGNRRNAGGESGDQHRPASVARGPASRPSGSHDGAFPDAVCRAPIRGSRWRRRAPTRARMRAGLYEQVFFTDAVKFQYPPTALLVVWRARAARPSTGSPGSRR